MRPGWVPAVLEADRSWVTPRRLPVAIDRERSAKDDTPRLSTAAGFNEKQSGNEDGWLRGFMARRKRLVSIRNGTLTLSSIPLKGPARRPEVAFNGSESCRDGARTQLQGIHNDQSQTWAFTGRMLYKARSERVYESLKRRRPASCHRLTVPYRLVGTFMLCETCS
jgi:hypothetical protein